MAKQEAVKRTKMIRNTVFLAGLFAGATVLAAAKAPAKIWVSKIDGTLQCEKALPEAALAEMRNELEKTHVQVFESKKVPNQMMVIALCGAPTGNENAFLISEGDFEKVEKLGFKKSKN